MKKKLKTHIFSLNSSFPGESALIDNCVIDSPIPFFQNRLIILWSLCRSAIVVAFIFAVYSSTVSPH